MLTGRVLTGSAAVAALAVVAATLFSVVPDSSERPLVPYVPGMQPMAIELPGPTQHHEYGPEPHRLLLSATDAKALTQHAAIRVLMADFGTNAEIESAAIVFGQGDCRFEPGPEDRLTNNDYLTFRRNSACDSGVDDNRAELRIDLSAPARIGVWTQTQPAWMPAVGLLTVVDRRAPDRSERPAVNGLLVDEYPSSHTRRAGVLALLWRTTPARIIGIAAALGDSSWLASS